jgi:hypothetical protein
MANQHPQLCAALCCRVVLRSTTTAVHLEGDVERLQVAAAATDAPLATVVPLSGHTGSGGSCGVP